MKKKILVLCFLFVVALSQVVLGKSYSVDSVDIKVRLQPDGSALVTENITMTFDGDFSRFIRDIPLSKEYFITDVSVKENGKEYKKLATLDPSRPAGSYAVVEKNGLLVTEFYYKTNKETRNFEFSYTIENAVIVHEDVVELNRKFIDKGWDKIKKLDITVLLPPGAAKEEVKVWSHGPLWGRAAIESGQKVHYQIKDLAADAFAEVRVTAPLRLFPDATERHSGKKALAGIIEQEQKLAEQANAEREQARLALEEEEQAEGLYGILAIAIAIFNCAGAFYIRYKSKNKNKAKVEPKYYRDLPSGISPAEVGKLTSYSRKLRSTSGGGGGSSSLYTATLLDLSLKKLLEIKNNALPGKKTRAEDIQLKVLPANKETPSLLGHEVTLLEFLKSALPDHSTGTMADIALYSESESEKAREYLSEFGQQVESELQAKSYFSVKQATSGLKKVFYVAIFLLTIVAILLSINSNSVVSMLMVVLSIMLCPLLIAGSVSSLSQKGIDELALWQGFKNFLSDFTLFEEKELPELVVWQKYLVYAVVLGKAKDLLEQLPNVYPQLGQSDYLIQHREFALFYTISNEQSDVFAVFNDFGEQMSSASRVASSSDSSGSGGGGGSSGGSSGGGSGGGGRAD